MTTEPTHCPIWGEPFPATIDHTAIHGPHLIVDSPRAGGRYQISNRANVSVNELNDAQKARLITLLVDERRRGNSCPEIDSQTVEDALTRIPLSVHERAERMLNYLVAESKAIGDDIPVHEFADAIYAWSESVSWSEAVYLLRYLVENEWAKLVGQGSQYTRKMPDGKTRIIFSDSAVVTVAGYSRVAEQKVNTSSSQAFVAMWFDPSMDDAYTQGIDPGIADAGYQPLRIDHKMDVNKIDDEIIAEIRRSRFLVADFTHGDDGARGGVYFEAGFAQGLGLPVIFSCHKDVVSKLHFDTRQYHHIVWETPSELREGLRNRIPALIGDGPGREVGGG